MAKYSNFESSSRPWSERKKKWLVSFTVVAVTLLIIIIIAVSVPSSSYFKATMPKGKVLIVTGLPRNEHTQRAEVIDLENPDNECIDFGNFSMPLSFATGGFLNGNTPLVCGGKKSRIGNYSDKCLSVGTGSSSLPVVDMLTRRVAPASVVLDDGQTLWITGGGSGPYTWLNSTEYFSLTSRRSQWGPPLPIKVSRHCMVKLSPTRVMLIGGYERTIDYEDRTWIYDFTTKKWTRGPSLLEGTSDLACGIFKDSETQEDIVVAGPGARPYSYYTQSTQLWKVDSDQFVHGPPLHVSIHSANGITSADGKHFILIGGSGSHMEHLYSLYRLQCFNFECQWTKMEQELQVARMDAVVMLLPDNLATCSLRKN